MKKIIVCKEGIETLSYFSEQLASAFAEFGYPIFRYILDPPNPDLQIKHLQKFIASGDAILITFNFNGIRGEEELYLNGVSFWAYYKIPVINIMVDHPFYYPELLKKVETELGFSHFVQLLVDRDHLAFVKRFYPQLQHVGFLPLAGSKAPDFSSYSHRPYDVVFVGNYTPPEQFEPYITRINDEYTAFYRGILDDFIAHPQQNMETVFLKHLLREMPDSNDADLYNCMGHMIFLDLYIRFYFRGKILQTLADKGIRVHVWGSGFEKIACKHPENLILEGPTDTPGCLAALAQAKIALNIMPWFKDGAHDRAYSAMCNGALCITDESTYLSQQIKTEQAGILYDLEGIDKLPALIQEYLSCENKRLKIANKGYTFANQTQTWKQRAEKLISWFDCFFV